MLYILISINLIYIIAYRLVYRLGTPSIRRIDADYELLNKLTFNQEVKFVNLKFYMIKSSGMNPVELTLTLRGNTRFDFEV